MKFNFKIQDYQTDAVDAVVDCFEGQIYSDGLTYRKDVGDIFVTLIILCEQIGIDPEECLSMAYEKISKRKGRTINGMFVKEEDLIDE